MDFRGYLVTIATFVLVAGSVYLTGLALLASWPMWAMMGFGPGWAVGLLAIVVGLTGWIIWTASRGRTEAVDVRGTLDSCPQCGSAVEPDYVICPDCHTALQPSCPICQRPRQAGWSFCPYCGAEGTGTPSPGVQDPQDAHGIERGSSDRMEVAGDQRR